MIIQGYLRRRTRMQKTITSIIKGYLADTGWSQAKLARALGEKPQPFGQKLKANGLDTEYLMRICKILNRDFFSDLSTLLRQELAASKGAELDVPYGTLTYQNLLEENVQLHRELRAANAKLEHLKSSSHAATITSQLKTRTKK